MNTMAEAFEQEQVLGSQPWYEWPEYQRSPSEEIRLTIGSHAIWLYNFAQLTESQALPVHIAHVSRQYGSVLGQFMNRYPAATQRIDAIVVTNKFDTPTLIDEDGGMSRKLGGATLEQGLIELAPGALVHTPYLNGELPVATYVAALLHEAGKFVLPELMPVWMDAAKEAGEEVQSEAVATDDALHAIVAFEYSGHILESEAPWKYQFMIDFTAKSRTEDGVGRGYPMPFSQKVTAPERIVWPPVAAE